MFWYLLFVHACRVCYLYMVERISFVLILLMMIFKSMTHKVILESRSLIFRISVTISNKVIKMGLSGVNKAQGNSSVFWCWLLHCFHQPSQLQCEIEKTGESQSFKSQKICWSTWFFSCHNSRFPGFVVYNFGKQQVLVVGFS